MRRTLIAGLSALLVAGLGAGGLALADGPGPRAPKKSAAVQKAETKAVQQQFGQTGEITLANGALKLNVPSTYYFMPASDARAHLARIGARPPAGDVLGMIVPAGSRPIDPEFWGAVISTNPLGRVAEERADRFAAADFIDEVRGARAAPAPRVEAFGTPPVHDGARHLTAWTERYPGPASDYTIRNEQRLLGRSLVAGVTIDGKAGQIASIAAAAPEIARMVSFQPGQTYADYKAGTDPAPLYDLPSLLTLKTKPTSVEVAAAPAPTPSPSTNPPPPGIPAQSKGLQPVAEGASVDAPPPSFDMSNIGQWLPWIGGGLVLLAVIPWLVGMARRPRPERRAVVKQDPNLTPSNE